MAAKNTLKYKRNETRPLPDLVNELIDKCLGAILSLDFKASIADLVTLIRLRLKLMPPDETPPRMSGPSDVLSATYADARTRRVHGDVLPGRDNGSPHAWATPWSSH